MPPRNTGPQQPTPAELPHSEPAQPSPPPGGSVRHLPVPHVPVPRVRIPAPPVTGVPGRVLWWGGLATVAAVGVLDWPVAAAIAAGTYVAERRARAGREGTAPPGPQGSPGGTHEGSD